MALLILAGCGGSGKPKAQQQWQTVHGASFRFKAPKEWSVVGSAAGAKAEHGAELVQVSTFPLARTYTDALFTKVEGELAARMATVAQQANGTVKSHSVVTVDGARSHSYDVVAGGRTSRYTFVLRGKREFLLLCSAAADVCDELAASFAAG
ncbi:MAG TPA: hypothetical protein VI408_05020 [Gaiellaceae bacterium]